MRIRNFNYNGFYGKLLRGFAPYTAKFVEWTKDPGIARCLCSDGLERLIPSFAFAEKDINLPEQTYEKGKLIFGMPCHS